MTHRAFHKTANTTAASGFTVIELLVSLTILAMLLALVPGTLKLGRRAWETPGQLDRGSDAAAALAFLERNIKGVVPLFDRGTSGIPRLAFSGQSQTLSFIVPMGSGPYGGGLYRIDAGALGGSAPALRVSLYTSEASGSRAAPLAEERSLASRYRALQFRYFGTAGAGDDPRWQEQWPRADRLPDLIEIIASPKDKSLNPGPAFRAEFNLRTIQ